MKLSLYSKESWNLEPCRRSLFLFYLLFFPLTSSVIEVIQALAVFSLIMYLFHDKRPAYEEEGGMFSSLTKNAAYGELL